MSDSVKVAVRVRPFNKREKDFNARLCIRMNGNTTAIVDATGAERTFTFDYSYWSHDGFEEKPDGLMVPANPKYADQQQVFGDLGALVLENAWEGYNTSLFAYGQTGSGKSYSMVGYGVNRGIVPISCEEMFRRVSSEHSNPNVRFKVKLSMLEIYNEQVRDLLVAKTRQGGLPVREDTKLGRFVVKDLSAVDVNSYQDIEAQIELGTTNRTIASTKMNNTSSRAHTIISIMFEQITKDEKGQEMSKRSEINLVDLAGSERADATGATGDRLKEGSNINRSLSTLGNVIAALAEGKSKHVPYRDSVLTKLLKNALGGNSKTIMIAALSPADINYDETLSTLRYADRAKQIKNNATVNESPTDKLIRELREQVEMLMLQLDGSGRPMAVDVNQPSLDVDALRRQMEEEIRSEMESLARQMAFTEGKEQAAPSAASALDTATVERERNKLKQKEVPHLTNLNEDPSLNRVVCHFLECDRCRIGKWADLESAADQSVDPDRPEIILGGLSIRKEHALIERNGNAFCILPGSAVAETKVNGQVLKERTRLLHGDRVLFGTSNLFVFVHPTDPTASASTPTRVDYEFAQSELAKASGFAMDGKDAEEHRRIEAVLEMLPLIGEVNAMAEEMNKGLLFEIALVSSHLLGSGQGPPTTHVMVRAKDTHSGNEWLLDRGFFMERRFEIQAVYEEWSYSRDMESPLCGPPASNEDPFALQLSEFVVGVSSIFIKFLAHGLEFDGDYELIDFHAKACGTVNASFVPCTAEGEPFDEEHYVEDPSELVGKPYHVKVCINSARIDKAKFAHGLRCRFLLGDYGEFHTLWVHNTTSPTFNMSHILTIERVTPEVVTWMETGAVKVQLLCQHKPRKAPLGVGSRQRSKAELLHHVEAAEKVQAQHERERQELEAALEKARQDRETLSETLRQMERSSHAGNLQAQPQLAASEAQRTELANQTQTMATRLAASDKVLAEKEELLRLALTQQDAIRSLCLKYSKSPQGNFEAFWKEVAAIAFQGRENCPTLEPQAQTPKTPQSSACLVM